MSCQAGHAEAERGRARIATIANAPIPITNDLMKFLLCAGYSASSPESVGEFWLGEVTEAVI
jgi:hypothetical protein